MDRGIDQGHTFAQVPGALVRVCWCGKWPDHHIHTGDWESCGCDECRVLRDIKTDLVTAIIVDPEIMGKLIRAADPVAAILDAIERVNDLPKTSTTIEGVWDGEAPTR